MLTTLLSLIFLQAQPVTLPSAEDTIKYLNQAIDWYRHLSVEEGIVVDSATGIGSLRGRLTSIK